MDERTLDREAERLFARNGAAPSDNPGLMAVTRFVDDLREAYASSPDPATRAVHIQAAVAAYRDAGVFSNGHHPNGSKASSNGSRTLRRSRRFLVRGGVAAGALVLAGGSAMAATGSLPDVAQDAVSRVAKTIGISIPKSDVRDAKDDIGLDIDADRDARVTRIKSRSADEKDAKAKAPDVDVDDDDDDGDGSDGSDGSDGGISRSTGSRRPSNGSPSRPAEPARPDSGDDDDDDDGDDPSGGGGRGDPSGGGSADTDDDPSDPSDDDGDGGGRGDPLDGSSGGSDEDTDADDSTGDDAGDAGDDDGGLD